VIVLSIALRLVVLPLLSTNFTSDFEDIHHFAIDVVSGHPFANLGNYPSIPWATHLNMTGLVMSLVYRIFGTGPVIAKMFMVVLATLTVWLVYLTSKELVNARIGFIAASIYGTLPSLICYTGVLTGEHFALPFIMLAVLLYARMKRSENQTPFYYAAGYTFCGISIGLGDWFRPGGIILLVALIIADLIYMNRDRMLYRFVIPLILLILSYMVVGNLAVTISEGFFNTDIMSTTQKRGYFILIGMNPETQGRISLEDRGIAFEAYERFKDDNAAANDYLIQLTMDRLKGEPILEIFRSKFLLIWSNHEQLFQISLNGSNDVEVVEVMSHMESIIYLMITVFTGANICSSFMKRTHPAVFTMQLFVLGFAIWVLILEAQNRYAIITFPFLILLGSSGLNDMMTFIRKLRQPSSTYTK
jgi:4-amino-4-deoxy-L-arabinose transferase-like glycosyltransferase